VGREKGKKGKRREGKGIAEHDLAGRLVADDVHLRSSSRNEGEKKSARKTGMGEALSLFFAVRYKKNIKEREGGNRERL